MILDLKLVDGVKKIMMRRLIIIGAARHIMVTSHLKVKFGGAVVRKEKIIQVARNLSIRKKIWMKMKMINNNRKKTKSSHSRTKSATVVNKKVMRLKIVLRIQIIKHLIMMKQKC
jgi:hypothetical protein